MSLATYLARRWSTWRAGRRARALARGAEYARIDRELDAAIRHPWAKP